jgi:Cys-tRNA synthase (O-phospho-L-seryl-tRNA:Cys-tRNA synthase)
MAFMALNINSGNKVITVPYTRISTAEVIALLRAKPVFVDVQPDTFNMDPKKLETAITPRTRAIMPVGIYGQYADMTRINAIAEKHGIPVIEDAAQCFGATHKGKKACNQSLIGCTSFFPSKSLGATATAGPFSPRMTPWRISSARSRIHCPEKSSTSILWWASMGKPMNTKQLLLDTDNRATCRGCRIFP